MKDLKNKGVLITGASSGIGRALAYKLAQKGVKLILSARNKQHLEDVAALIKRSFPEAPEPIVIPCDVTDSEDIKRLFSSCSQQGGDIDILINNAGIGIYGEAELISLEDFRKIMEVNYFGAVQCMLEAVAMMKKRKQGIIVNISSVAALHGVPYLSAYGASKAALMTFSQSLRAELRDTGISLMNVHPGYTKTRFFRNEKIVGEARRPKGPYAPAQRVAAKIVNAIIHNRHKVVLSLEGKALAVLHGIFPGAARRSMKNIASNLIK